MTLSALQSTGLLYMAPLLAPVSSDHIRIFTTGTHTLQNNYPHTLQTSVVCSNLTLIPSTKYIPPHNHEEALNNCGYGHKPSLT